MSIVTRISQRSTVNHIMVHGIEYLEFPEFQRRMEDLVGLCLYQDYLRLLIFEDLVLLFNLDSLPCCLVEIVVRNQVWKI